MIHGNETDFEYPAIDVGQGEQHDHWPRALDEPESGGGYPLTYILIYGGSALLVGTIIVLGLMELAA